MLGSWIQKKMTTAKKTKTHFQNSATVGKSNKKSLKLDHFSKSFLKLIEFLSHFIIEKSPKSAFTKVLRRFKMRFWCNFWGTTETHRLTQTSTDQHRPAQTGTDLHKTYVLYYLGPEWNQWDQLGPLGTTWDHLGPLGTIKNVLFNTVRDT